MRVSPHLSLPEQCNGSLPDDFAIEDHPCGSSRETIAHMKRHEMLLTWVAVTCRGGRFPPGELAIAIFR